MKTVWIRSRDHIPYTTPSMFFVLGCRGSGKSSLLEHIGENYLQRGATILDLYASKDGESLGWLRSEYAKDARILLLRGEAVDVTCSYDTKTVAALALPDFEKYNIVISAAPCYSNPEDEFANSGRIIDLLYSRHTYNKIIFALCREASNLFYSRLKLCHNQNEAKASLIYALREMRHSGVSLALDTIKSTSIDLDVRVLADYLFLKAQGWTGLPNDLFWLYSVFRPERFQTLKAKEYIVLSRRGAIGAGLFPYPGWHKKEREDLLRLLDIRCAYGEIIVQSESKGTFTTVGDTEHSEMIGLYVLEDMGMTTIGKLKERAGATVMNQIDHHNAALRRSGFCPQCRRVKSGYETTEARRPSAKTPRTDSQP